MTQVSTSEAGAKKSARARQLEVFNPATGVKIGSVALFDEEGVKSELAKVRAAQPAWAARPLKERCEIVRRFAQILGDRSREVADLIVAENGKTLQEAYECEILGVTYLASYFASNAERILAPEKIPMKLYVHKWSHIEFRPRGVVYVISPWNFPFAIPTGEILMALIAGNTVIHKPASLTPLIALKTEELLREAGVPEDAYRVIPASGRTASTLIGPGVDYVNFTGSTGIGRQVAETCGKYLLPCSMELGGKDPTIVLEDADIERTTNAVVWGAFANSGQVCASVERVYVPRAIFDDFVERVVKKTKKLRQGNGADADIDVGAMTDKGQLAIVAQQVADARKAGATIHTGGELVEGPGQFYPPTVLTNLSDDMAITHEESFGPVLPLMPYDTVDEAIARANDSCFGLTASVFGKDEKRAQEVASRVEAGTVMLNDVMFTHALAETPWAGVKESGTGRVHSDEGLRDLCMRIHVNGNRVPAMRREPVWYPYSAQWVDLLDKATRILAEKGVGRVWKAARVLFGR